MLVIVSETAEPVADLVRDLKINFRQESVIQITYPAAAVSRRAEPSESRDAGLMLVLRPCETLQ
jgi:hypothetical protein